MNNKAFVIAVSVADLGGDDGLMTVEIHGIKSWCCRKHLDGAADDLTQAIRGCLLKGFSKGIPEKCETNSHNSSTSSPVDRPS